MPKKQKKPTTTQRLVNDSSEIYGSYSSSGVNPAAAAAPAKDSSSKVHSRALSSILLAEYLKEADSHQS